MHRVDRRIVPAQTFDNTAIATLTLGAVVTTAIATQVDAHLRGAAPIQQNNTRAKMIRTGVYAVANLTSVVVAKTTDNPLATFFSFVVSNTVAALVNSQIRDYDDAGEVATMRIAASSLTFGELVKKHGLERLSQLQIPTLQDKFIQEYQGYSYRQITQDYPLDTISQHHLCPLTNDGFLHSKFIREAIDRKLDFVLKLTLDDHFKQIVSNRVYTGLEAIQAQARTIEDLPTVLNRISGQFPNRTELQTKKFESIKKNIPTEARHHLREVFEQNKKEIAKLDQEFQTTLTSLDTAFPGRTEVQERQFQERERNIPIEARRFGQEVANRTAQIASTQLRSSTIRGQIVSSTMRDASNGQGIVNQAARIAEEEHAKRLRAQLRNDRLNQTNINTGLTQQESYNQAVFNARRMHDTKVLSIQTLEKTLLDQEIQKRITHVQQEQASLKKFWEKQQFDHDLAVAGAREIHKEAIIDLEAKLTRVLTPSS